MTNKQKYQQFCKEQKDIPIFSQDWWLDSVCGEDNWEVLVYEKGGKIWATMPYFKEKKYIFDTITMPKLTQTMGVFIKYPAKQKYYKKLSWEKEILGYFVKNLPPYDSFVQNFHYSFTNWLPFYWRGFSQTTRYTYVIEDIPLEELEKNLETDIRRRRKKAFTAGVSIFESEDIEGFYELNKMTFARQGREIPYSFKFVENLYNNCKKHHACKLFFAKNHDGVLIAGNFLIYDEHTVYYLMGGIDPKYRDLGGMDVVQFESIKFALEHGRAFDFEGSMIESIEKYFRSFGAVQKSYFTLRKTNSKLLRIRNMLMEVLK